MLRMVGDVPEASPSVIMAQMACSTYDTGNERIYGIPKRGGS